MATLKKTKNWFKEQLSLNAGHKYCRMLPFEHSAILSNLIKLPFVIKIFVLSIFERPFHTGFTVYDLLQEITRKASSFDVGTYYHATTSLAKA